MVLNRSRILAAAAAGAIFAVGGTAAHAQTALPVGGAVTPPPTISTGTLTLLSSATATFAGTNAGNTISGSLFSAVFRRADNGLDFFYQFTANNGGGNPANITSLSLGNFTGNTLSVAQTQDDIDGAGGIFVGGGVSSAQASRFDPDGVLFQYSGITPGNSSATVLIRSNATAFSTNGAASLQSGAGVSANTVGTVIAAQAVAAAPEPGSLALLGTGALGVTGMVIRRRRAK